MKNNNAKDKERPYEEEPIEAEIVYSSLDYETHSENVVNGCYCHVCHKKIDIGSDTCPECGEDDPFYFKELKGMKSRNNSIRLGAFVIALILTVSTEHVLRLTALALQPSVKLY